MTKVKFINYKISDTVKAMSNKQKLEIYAIISEYLEMFIEKLT